MDFFLNIITSVIIKNTGARQGVSSLPVCADCARKNPKFPHPPLDLQQHRRRRRPSLATLHNAQTHSYEGQKDFQAYMLLCLARTFDL